MARKLPTPTAPEAACQGHIESLKRQINQLEELVEDYEKQPKTWALSGTLYEFRKQLADTISFATPIGK